jgi:hypothetical protein
MLRSVFSYISDLINFFIPVKSGSFKKVLVKIMVNGF